MLPNEWSLYSRCAPIPLLLIPLIKREQKTSQCILCSEISLSASMQVYANGMVTVKPDFNSGRPAYRVENKHKGTVCNTLHKNISICSCSAEIFEYRLEHVSQPMSKADIAREKQILSEVNTYLSSLECMNFIIIVQLHCNVKCLSLQCKMPV